MKTPIQIVDDNDNLLMHKDRAAIDYSNDIYRVSALWLTNSKGEILIAQRKLTKDKDPGKWGPAVAGTVEEGETYGSNIYKEAEEEIGLKDVRFEQGPKQRMYKPRNYFCQWYTAETDRDSDAFVLQEDEVEAVAWVSPEQLVSDIRTNSDKYLPTMAEQLKLFITEID